MDELIVQHRKGKYLSPNAKNSMNDLKRETCKKVAFFKEHLVLNGIRIRNCVIVLLIEPNKASLIHQTKSYNSTNDMETMDTAQVGSQTLFGKIS